MTTDGTLKLTDIGFSPNVKHKGLNSLCYMSPEMLVDGTIGKANDIWSIGICCYVLIEAKFPFSGRGEAEIIHAILTAHPKPFQKSIPLQIQSLIFAMLNKDPGSRITIEQIYLSSMFSIFHFQKDHLHQINLKHPKIISFLCKRFQLYHSLQINFSNFASFLIHNHHI
jgi:serine/threonine protein kinase